MVSATCNMVWGGMGNAGPGRGHGMWMRPGRQARAHGEELPGKVPELKVTVAKRTEKGAERGD